MKFEEIYPSLRPAHPSSVVGDPRGTFRIEIGQERKERAVIALDLERSTVTIESMTNKGKLACSVSRSFSGTVEALSAAMGARHALELLLSTPSR